MKVCPKCLTDRNDSRWPFQMRLQPDFTLKVWCERCRYLWYEPPADAEANELKAAIDKEGEAVLPRLMRDVGAEAHRVRETAKAEYIIKGVTVPWAMLADAKLDEGSYQELLALFKEAKDEDPGA